VISELTKQVLITKSQEFDQLLSLDTLIMFRVFQEGFGDLNARRVGLYKSSIFVMGYISDDINCSIEEALHSLFQLLLVLRFGV